MLSASTVLILDDNPRSLEMLSVALSQEGVRILTASHPEAALELIRKERPDLLLTDLVMPGMDGLQVLRRVMEIAPRTEVVLMTAHYTTETAVAAIKMGAADYVQKPVKLPLLRQRIATIIDAANLRHDGLQGPENGQDISFHGIVARSPSMWQLLSRVRRVAPHFRSVLVQGETGTGKELVAAALHQLSGRTGPYVILNCSAVVETLFESELFGHVKGAFTGADRDKTGLFEYAHGGTLFLDEIGEMPLATQAKLLRAVQNQEVQRLGALTPRKVDVRVVAATNKDIKAASAVGRFREDLYYRLSMVTLAVPPLRERPEDIPLLTRHFMDRFSHEHQKPLNRLTQRALVVLQRHSWPGNVRELENAIGHASMMAREDILDVPDLPDTLLGSPETEAEQRPLSCPSTADLDARASSGTSALADAERALIARVLQEAAGNQSEAARTLGIGRDALRYKLKRYGLL